MPPVLGKLKSLFHQRPAGGDQQLTPGSTSYHSTLQVQAFDIAGPASRRHQHRPGGPHRRLVPRLLRVHARRRHVRDADGFLAQLEMESGGQRTVVGTDGSWLVGADGDRQRRPHGRAASGFPAAASDARQPAARRPPGRQLRPPSPARWRRPPGSWRNSSRSPSPGLANGNQIVDLGQNINGWIRLSRLGAAGTSVDAGLRRSPGR